MAEFLFIRLWGKLTETKKSRIAIFIIAHNGTIEFVHGIILRISKSFSCEIRLFISFGLRLIVFFFFFFDFVQMPTGRINPFHSWNLWIGFPRKHIYHIQINQSIEMHLFVEPFRKLGTYSIWQILFAYHRMLNMWGKAEWASNFWIIVGRI